MCEQPVTPSEESVVTAQTRGRLASFGLFVMAVAIAAGGTRSRGKRRLRENMGQALDLNRQVCILRAWDV